MTHGHTAARPLSSASATELVEHAAARRRRNAASSGRLDHLLIDRPPTVGDGGGRASHSSICESKLSWAMRDVGLVTRGAATRSHCLHGALIDTDRATPGIQPSCRVVVASDIGSPRSTRLEVPPCDSSGGERCFTLAIDPACASTETRLAFRVTGTAAGEMDAVAANETLSVACDVDVDAPALVPSTGETRAID